MKVIPIVVATAAMFLLAGYMVGRIGQTMPAFPVTWSLVFTGLGEAAFFFALGFLARGGRA